MDTNTDTDPSTVNKTYNPSWIGVSECMARIKCQASLLKIDDYRLKGLAPSHRVCDMCDYLYTVESIQHILMQCRGMQHKRENM